MKDPRDLERDLEAAGRIGRRVAELYRWAHSFAQAAPRGEEAKVRTGAAADPTASAALAQQLARSRMRAAGRLVERAVRDLRAAEADLIGAVGPVAPDVAPAPGRFPRLASQAEIEDARRAQARREARGEGWGAG